MPPPSTSRLAVSTFSFLAAILLCLELPSLGTAAPSRAVLERDFANPPLSARPWVYWFWLNGNITSNGITADLAAMKRVGIGGVLIMEVDQGTPKGTADFGKGPWRELFKHVCAEAHRLGLEVNMSNDAGWCGSGGPWITPEYSMQKLVWTETNVTGPRRLECTLPPPQAIANYYRDIALFAFPMPKGNARIADIQGKAAFEPKHIPVTARFRQVAPEETIARDRILDLAACSSTNGQLSWDVPAGHWTILRMGHTSTGKDNHPAPEPGRGLESDKLSKAATDLMFRELMGKLIADSKPLAGKTLVSTHIDSWETGSQNWTPRFREEFQRLRGYDPLLLLPIVTGRIVESAEFSERFLWDLRQTVSDLLVENYAGEFRRLAHQRGLRLSIEAYDGTPCDDMTYAGQADEPMAEFWSWGYNTAYSCVEMSSAAHVYGRRILGAEAFTANDQEKWQHHPASIKTLGDWAFCEGINRFVFHRYALQPWSDRKPGMSMGPWGLHYERTETWWEQSAAWHQYLARCQYLLRQGTFVADICFLEPEGSPMRFVPTLNGREGNTPERPRYNFDGCTSEVLFNRLKLKNGRLELPDGPSYRLLVLPQIQTMTPRLLRRVKELVDQGATVIGPPPARSPSLTGYPACDSQLQEMAKALWTGEMAGTGDRQGKTRRHVIWGASFKTPQPELDEPSPVAHAKWIWHREGNPAASAPPGTRYFRRVLALDPDRAVDSAQFSLTVDNTFELWVNGQNAASGDNFKHVYRADIKNLLRPGTNVLALTAVNTMTYPNPAGFIGTLAIKFHDGQALEIDSDSQWMTATNVGPAWRTNVEIGQRWNPAMELGPLGMEPWGELDSQAGPPYVYPSFNAIAGVLGALGVPPDFEADPALRFIHRRGGPLDLYFVANSQTNWLQARCAFRVTGKHPELWDPISGRISRAAAFEEKDGRTFVPLNFEPAGSVFVVFRRSTKPPRNTAIIAASRNGQDLLPQSGASKSGPPVAEFSSQPGGPPRLLAREPGQYVVRLSSGQTCSAAVSSLPQPFEVPGPWEVQFEPGRGAPQTVSFERLQDWSKYSDPGVKFFSGVATYLKRFNAPAELDAIGQRLWLDLGEVAVIAQVTLNGKDLGTLWKPPYRVEATDALQSGENRLEIKVVNLWPNRMIGDEQLPEDSDRNEDGTLKKWPQWLEQDRPSPTGRFTFTSWRLWKKDSPLQPSGLLGPVTLSAAKELSFIPARPN